VHRDGIEATGIVGGCGRCGHAGQYIEPVLHSPLLTRLLDGVPSQCGICRGWGRARVCGACLNRFAPGIPRCRRCAIEVPAGQPECGACLHEPPPYERSIAAFDYVPPWSHLITRFKFHGGLDLLPVFVDRMLQAHRSAVLPAPTLLLPIPLSDERLRERGYNQAWELARRLGRALQVPADAHVLLRIRATPHQISLPLPQRAGNVRGAFAIEPRRHAELAGRQVALVDDVVTTGATVGEAARVLLAGGAASVQVWMIARTPRPGSA
jgi:ComF family protein